MKRTCKRCGHKLDMQIMHYNKKEGWVCDKKEECTIRIYNDKRIESYSNPT